MNIFDFALKMEQESEQNYRKLATKASHEGLKNIFNILAENENNQYVTLEKLRDEKYSDITLELLDEPGDIWISIMPDNEAVNLSKEEVEDYQKAMVTEDDAHDYYIAQAENIEDDQAKEVFLMLARQKQKHSMLIENIIDHIEEYTDRVEDAEIDHKKTR